MSTEPIIKIRQAPKQSLNNQLSKVCQIVATDNPELRGKGGCWAIVSTVNEFSCIVRVCDGEYIIGLQHLKSFNYLPAECEHINRNLKRNY